MALIIENVSSKFFMLEDSMMGVFSDDSRFLYMFINFMTPLSLSVFDTIYNKFVTLLPDSMVTDLLYRLKGFKDDTYRPNMLFINSETLLILFNANDSDQFEGCVLLTVVKLNFINATFSIIDHKIINDCYEKARLVKFNDKFLIIHTFTTDVQEFWKNDQFLAYFTFYLHKNEKLEVLENRIVFDFDYQISGNLGTWKTCNNKLWCIRTITRSLNFELIYFDLNEKNAKAVSVEIFEVGEDDGEPNIIFQWCDNLLIKYYRNDGEFSFLDLNNCQWSRIFQRTNIVRIESEIPEFEFQLISILDTFGVCGYNFERHFDSALNALIFVKPKKQFLKVPFRTPLKLTEIAWITVLNNGLLNELKKRKLVIYPELF